MRSAVALLNPLVPEPQSSPSSTTFLVVDAAGGLTGDEDRTEGVEGRTEGVDDNASRPFVANGAFVRGT